MLKLLVIRSTQSQVPLAEVRTDGQSVDFVVDNTNGSLPKAVGSRYQRLVAVVGSSRQLSMEEPQQATVNLLRYLLSDGRVVEITSDGKTCLINGKLQEEKQKQELFQEIKDKKVSIASRQGDPVPVMPTQKPRQQQAEPESDLGKMISLSAQHARSRMDKEAGYDHRWDANIEDADYSQSDDPKESKSFAYFMRHGRG